MTKQEHHWEFVEFSHGAPRGYSTKLRTSRPMTLTSAIRYPAPMLRFFAKYGEITCIDEETAILQLTQLIPNQNMTRAVIRPIKVWMLKPSWESHPRKAGFESYANVHDVISDALRHFGIDSLSNTEILSKDEFTFHYDDGFFVRFFRVCK